MLIRNFTKIILDATNRYCSHMNTTLTHLNANMTIKTDPKTASSNLKVTHKVWQHCTWIVQKIK